MISLLFLRYNFAMNTITIPRLAGQAVGGIALLKHEDGRELTINVEYNQLGPLLKSTGDKKGDVANESGFSPYPGNTNSFILDHDLYCTILEDCNFLWLYLTYLFLLSQRRNSRVCEPEIYG